MKEKISQNSNNSAYHGDDYYIKQFKLMIASIGSYDKHTTNDAFAAYLIDHGIPYKSEYPVGNFIYDFKLGNYLIEVNPWATHSTDFAPRDWSPKTETYHRDKTLNAINNGFICVHLFDWMNIDAIIYGVATKSLYLVDTYKPVKHIYDTKLKQLTNKENDNTVIIYDDGFEIIY